MSKFKKSLPVILTILISLIIILITSMSNIVKDNIKEVYNVYLDGNLIGAVKSKKSLEKYIDNEQKELKEQYNVDKVYIPNGIDIEKCVTHNAKILSEKQIYNIIKENKSFTIKGYIVNIKYSDEKEIKINVLKKSLFDKAVNKVLKVFIDSKDIENYRNGTQKNIETTGSIIENIYIEEYVVKPGDTIETVAFNNKLGVEEFLIVNPEFTSSNNLLSVGQKVSIALIDPIFSIVVEKHIVEDMDKPFSTIEKEDPSLYYGTSKIQTEGVNGIQRVTEKVKYVNGEAYPAIITGKTVIKEPINKIVLKGTKGYSENGVPAQVSGDWGWPTIYPYVITSYYGFRWGRLHAGIDISGCGFGSPIYSIGDGTVFAVTNNCSDRGFYGSTCGGGYGNAVRVRYNNGMEVIYSHIMGSNIRVSVGQKVTKGQVIGYMGNSGSSTGTHLHFQININGSSVNPLTLYK